MYVLLIRRKISECVRRYTDFPGVILIIRLLQHVRECLPYKDKTKDAVNVIFYIHIFLISYLQVHYNINTIVLLPI